MRLLQVRPSRDGLRIAGKPKSSSAFDVNSVPWSTLGRPIKSAISHAAIPRSYAPESKARPYGRFFVQPKAARDLACRASGPEVVRPLR
jgi:hypothetical protein